MKLHDGRVIQVKRRTEVSGGGFPVGKRGFQQYHELCYAPVGAYWKSKPEYRPETFELDGGKAYVKVTLGSFNVCGRHGYPKDGALYFLWSGSDWQQIAATDFPRGARLNLLQNPMGRTAADDVRGTVGQAEKEQRDAGLYYVLKLGSASGLNEVAPYEGICREYPVQTPVAPAVTNIFIGSGGERCA